MILFKNRNHHAKSGILSSQACLLESNITLDELATSTEGEFLRLGEKLQEFYARTKNLSDLSSELAGCLAGEELNQNMAGLQAIFTQIQQQDEATVQGITVLSSLLHRFEHIVSQLGRFTQTIRNLHTLCNFIKIESARLSSQNTGFRALSEDVRNLAVDVADKSTKLLNHSESLASLTRQGLQRMTDFQEKQQGQARAILDQAVKNLSDMNQRHQFSSEILADIAKRWKHIAQSIGEVVASLQFHDITRQRIEHVRDSLRDIRASIIAVQSTPDENNHGLKFWQFFSKFRRHFREDCAGLTGAILPCEVQLVQLKDADADMVAAVQRIMANLKQITEEIAVMAGEVRALASADNQKEESFLSNLEKKLFALGESISSFMKITREWSTTMEHLTTSIKDMSGFIREIEKIGIHMQMIARNASIHAAHIGQEGAALGILAESISHLSDDTTHAIDDIATNLRDIMTEAVSFRMHRSASTSLIASTPQTGMLTQIEDMIRPLHQMDRKVSELLVHIDHDGQALIEDIESAIQGITVHEKIHENIQSVILDLESMLEKMRMFGLASAGSHERQEVAEMAGRYTMEKERQLHQIITGSSAAIPIAAAIPVEAPPIASAGTEAAEDLGDNVELF
jgi:methyl-accepting chemotaxis protein